MVSKILVFFSGSYIATPAAVKPIIRMGFGIAASGIPDKDPLMLSFGGAKSFMKYRYMDYVVSGAKFINWRSDFLSSIDIDRAAIEGEFASVMESLKTDIEQMRAKAPHNFHRDLIETMLNGELREMLLFFGEVERIVVRGGKKAWKEIQKNIEYEYHSCRKDRLGFIAKAILDWTTTWKCDTYDDGYSQITAFTLLQYFASTGIGEKTCQEQNHRKCTMLSFMLARLDNRQELFKQKYNGGYTLLHFAAMTGMPCQVDVLLRLGCSLNVLSTQFNSPVSLALRRHNTLVARQLMWHGADIGSSLTLDHIRPKNPREDANKKMSVFNDSISRKTAYKAREFMISRLKALNNSFTSWVEAILAEADPGINLAIEAVKSSLHQIRIGTDPFDTTVKIKGISFVKVKWFLRKTKLWFFQKNFNMCIQHTESPTDPVVLFMIPCQYTQHDTTMPANFPHIVRVPMFTDALSCAQKIAEKERIQTEQGSPRTDHQEELAGCFPIKMVQQLT